MIEYLKGKIVHRRPTGVVVSVNGVGYGLDLPLSTLCEIAPDAVDVELWVYTHVREDALKLYGFSAPHERQLFEILLSVNGIGPKLALAILSTLDVASIKLAVVQEVSGVFEAVPGIGKRMAEKILVEMKAKLKRLNEMVYAVGPGAKDGKLAVKTLDVMGDVQSALENLGFKTPLIVSALRELTQSQDGFDFNSLLKDALLKLGGHEQKSAPIDAQKSSSDVTSIF